LSFSNFQKNLHQWNAQCIGVSAADVGARQARPLLGPFPEKFPGRRGSGPFTIAPSSRRPRAFWRPAPSSPPPGTPASLTTSLRSYIRPLNHGPHQQQRETTGRGKLDHRPPPRCLRPAGWPPPAAGAAPGKRISGFFSPVRSSFFPRFIRSNVFNGTVPSPPDPPSKRLDSAQQPVGLPVRSARKSWGRWEPAESQRRLGPGTTAMQRTRPSCQVAPFPWPGVQRTAFLEPAGRIVLSATAFQSTVPLAENQILEFARDQHRSAGVRTRPVPSFSCLSDYKRLGLAAAPRARCSPCPAHPRPATTAAFALGPGRAWQGPETSGSALQPATAPQRRPPPPQRPSNRQKLRPCPFSVHLRIRPFPGPSSCTHIVRRLFFFFCGRETYGPFGNSQARRIREPYLSLRRVFSFFANAAPQHPTETYFGGNQWNASTPSASASARKTSHVFSVGHDRVHHHPPWLLIRHPAQSRRLSHSFVTPCRADRPRSAQTAWRAQPAAIAKRGGRPHQKPIRKLPITARQPSFGLGQLTARITSNAAVVPDDLPGAAAQWPSLHPFFFGGTDPENTNLKVQ